MVIGSVIAWVSGKRLAMTDMSKWISLYNGMGGGAAAAIAAVELYSGNENSWLSEMGAAASLARCPQRQPDCFANCRA